jgi:hypothetical protein
MFEILFVVGGLICFGVLLAVPVGIVIVAIRVYREGRPHAR